MKLSDFDFDLPKELIAQEPAKPRDHSRLLVLDKESGNIEHRIFNEVADYLKAGDVLVLNNSKVFPARLLGNKSGTGGKIEIFLLKSTNGNNWRCLIGGRGGKRGLEIEIGKKLKAEILENNQDGTWEIKFNLRGAKLMEEIFSVGRPPLPPYIKRDSKKAGPFDRLRTIDVKNYQTVFADEKKIGSVAAPTAGLHFTPKLLKAIAGKGVRIEYVTLHVGLGTFAPVKVDEIEKHKMHEEWMEVSSKVLKNISKAKIEGRRVIAVGTTSVRVLESAYGRFNEQTVAGKRIVGETDIFIYPGYKFKVVDAMITNFHLPKSTLLMLVSALAGRKHILKAYEEVIKKKYRFYSYGDAMFIL